MIMNIIFIFIYYNMIMNINFKVHSSEIEDQFHLYLLYDIESQYHDYIFILI